MSASNKRNTLSRAIIPILILTTASLGFKAGDEIELENYLNGRRTSDVRKIAKNIRFVLAPHTRAKILKTRKLRHGNYGFEIKIETGPRKGKRVWIFYNRQNPGMKLLTKNNEETQTPELAKATETTRQHNVIEEKAAPADQTEADLPELLEDVTEAVAKTTAPQKDAPCNNAAPAAVVSSEAYPESISKSPSKDLLADTDESRVCRTRKESYDACTVADQIDTFKFKNEGGNPINQNAGYKEKEQRYREFEFLRSGDARQELGFNIADSMSGTLSEIQENYYMVFPRRVTPSIQVSDGLYHVTLPTGEKVQFKSDTREIVGGALRERTLQSAKGAHSSPVTYTGSGVIVRAAATGNDPRIRGNTASIIKPQCKNGQSCECQVPVTKLWTDNPDNPRFRYPTDLGFDVFLRRECKFSL